MKISDLKHKEIFVILALIYLAIRLPILTYVPFMQDEAFYSVMIEEQIEHPTAVVTLFGEPVGWKPPLFFWISGFFVQFLRDLPIPIEAVYRLPNILFGLINVFLVFFIFEKITGKKEEAFLMAMVYATIGITLHTDLRVLTDTMSGTFIFAGILAYLNSLKDSKLFLLGGAFTVLAYFVKQMNAAIVPIVAIVYLLQNDRKKIFNPLFLISLAAFPLAITLEEISHDAPVGAMTAHMTKTSILANLNLMSIGGSIVTLFPLSLVWLILSIFGFWKNLKENWAMSVWFCLIAFPIIAGVLMPFYFYPVIPPMVYFAFKFISKDGHKTKIDRFFYIIFFTSLVLSFVMGTATHLIHKDSFQLQKNAGEYLAGKENVLIIGKYMPGVPTYKMLEEKRETGRWLDYGLIILMKNTSDIEYAEFIENYSIKNNNTIDGNFAAMFAVDRTFRKDTNITNFDYITIIGNNTINPDGKVVLTEGGIRVYKRG